LNLQPLDEIGAAGHSGAHGFVADDFAVVKGTEDQLVEPLAALRDLHVDRHRENAVGFDGRAIGLLRQRIDVQPRVRLRRGDRGQHTDQNNRPARNRRP
jgi:hypothetical protein